MLNIYRVISLSLVMSLFFAAPLLCIHPVSLQLRKEQRLTVKHGQAKRVKVAWQSDSQASYRRGTNTLANSLLRAKNISDGLEDTISPGVFVKEKVEDWDND